MVESDFGHWRGQTVTSSTVISGTSLNLMIKVSLESRHAPPPSGSVEDKTKLTLLAV